MWNMGTVYPHPALPRGTRGGGINMADEWIVRAAKELGRLGRKCRAVEISPAYCAVAIQRWVDMTGGEPVLLETL